MDGVAAVAGEPTLQSMYEDLSCTRRGSAAACL